jgi:hypothetical protein
MRIAKRGPYWKRPKVDFGSGLKLPFLVMETEPKIVRVQNKNVRKVRISKRREKPTQAR